MAKGKTNQPIVMMITPEMMQEIAVQQLSQQGHTVLPLPRECIKADLVLGTNCHIMTVDMLKKPGIMLAAMKAARKRKKEKKNVKSTD